MLGRQSQLVIVLVLMMAAVGAAQLGRGPTSPGDVQALAPGKLLVASRQLRDPNFAEAVVLLIDHDKDGAAGLIINRRTEVPLASVFAPASLGVTGTRPAFAGGPVARANALMLIRSRPEATGVRNVAAGIDLVSTRERLEHTLATETDADRFRVYLGRAGWGPGQLEHETEQGAWHVLAADAAVVFDPDPLSVWRRLIRRTEMLQASMSRPTVLIAANPNAAAQSYTQSP